MPHTDFQRSRLTTQGVAVIDVPNQAMSHHAVKITCATAGVTFTVAERDRFDDAGAFSNFPDNVVPVGEKTVFTLPGAVQLRITPSNLSAPYSVSMSSF